jgi:DNA-binding LytR/AlgR family response regulator
MDKLKCLVVDDEDVAIDGIVDYMAGVDYLTLAGRCSSAVEAMNALREHPVDLMFLDINMPRLSGLEMLESLNRPPLVILTTAYSEYALDGFRLHVVDYLLKPYTFARFVQATDRALERHRSLLSVGGDAPEREMYIRQGDSFVRIVPDEIMLVEAMQNYLKLHLADKAYIIHQTMTSLEDMLPAERFYRVHNSYLVNVSRIESISGGRLSVAGKEIPLSKHRKEDFMRSVVYKNLVSK